MKRIKRQEEIKRQIEEENRRRFLAEIRRQNELKRQEELRKLEEKRRIIEQQKRMEENEERRIFICEIDSIKFYNEKDYLDREKINKIPKLIKNVKTVQIKVI